MVAHERVAVRWAGELLLSVFAEVKVSEWLSGVFAEEKVREGSVKKVLSACVSLRVRWARREGRLGPLLGLRDWWI